MKSLTSIPGFSKYSATISADGVAHVFNSKDEEIKMKGNSWIITNDEGKRVSLKATELFIMFPGDSNFDPTSPFVPSIEEMSKEAPAATKPLVSDIFPEVLDTIEPEVIEEKLPVEEGTIDTPKVKKTRTKKADQPAKVAKPRTAKLTLDQAKKILAAIAAGTKQAELARTYDVHQSTISDIKAGRLYPEAGGKKEVESTMPLNAETSKVIAEELKNENWEDSNEMSKSDII